MRLVYRCPDRKTIPRKLICSSLRCPLTVIVLVAEIEDSADQSDSIGSDPNVDDVERVV